MLLSNQKIQVSRIAHTIVECTTAYWSESRCDDSSVNFITVDKASQHLQYFLERYDGLTSIDFVNKLYDVSNNVKALFDKVQDSFHGRINERVDNTTEFYSYQDFAHAIRHTAETKRNYVGMSNVEIMKMADNAVNLEVK